MWAAVGSPPPSGAAPPPGLSDLRVRLRVLSSPPGRLHTANRMNVRQERPSGSPWWGGRWHGQPIQGRASRGDPEAVLWHSGGGATSPGGGGRPALLGDRSAGAACGEVAGSVAAMASNGYRLDGAGHLRRCGQWPAERRPDRGLLGVPQAGVRPAVNCLVPSGCLLLSRWMPCWGCGLGPVAVPSGAALHQGSMRTAWGGV